MARQLQKHQLGQPESKCIGSVSNRLKSRKCPCCKKTGIWVKKLRNVRLREKTSYICKTQQQCKDCLAFMNRNNFPTKCKHISQEVNFSWTRFSVMFLDNHRLLQNMNHYLLKFQSVTKFIFKIVECLKCKKTSIIVHGMDIYGYTS